MVCGRQAGKDAGNGKERRSLGRVMRGVLAGLGLGTVVAAAVLGVAALQIEQSKMPDPPKMVRPAVVEELHVAAGPKPVHPLMSVPGRLAGPLSAGDLTRTQPPVLALPGASPLPRLPAPPPDPADQPRSDAPVAVEMLGAGADGRLPQGAGTGPGPGLAVRPPHLAPPGVPAPRQEGGVALPAALPFPGPALPGGITELAVAEAVLMPAVPLLPPYAAAPAPAPASRAVPGAPSGGAEPAVPLPLSGLPALPPRPEVPDPPAAGDSVAQMARELPPLQPAVGSPATLRLSPPVPAALPRAAEPAALSGLPGPGALAASPAWGRPVPAAAADGPLLAVVLIDPEDGPLPDWARSVALGPDRLDAAPDDREVLARLAEPADRGALAAMAWRVSALPHPGPLLLGAAPAGEKALGAMQSFLDASGLGAVIDGAEMPDLGAETARTYPDAPLGDRLARAAAHARRDGAVILSVEDSPETRAAIGAFFGGPGRDLMSGTAGEALRRLSAR